LPPPMNADVAAHRPVAETNRRGRGRGRAAAVVDVDGLRRGVAGANVDLDQSAAGGGIGRVEDGEVPGGWNGGGRPARRRRVSGRTGPSPAPGPGASALQVARRHDPARFGQGGNQARGKAPFGPLVVVQGQPHLFEVVRAAHAGGSLADLLHGGEQEADEDGDDGDHHQQLDQGEARPSFHGWSSREGVGDPSGAAGLT